MALSSRPRTSKPGRYQNVTLSAALDSGIRVAIVSVAAIVNRGSVCRHNDESSNPTTATSPGRLSPMPSGRRIRRAGQRVRQSAERPARRGRALQRRVP